MVSAASQANDEPRPGECYSHYDAQYEACKKCELKAQCKTSTKALKEKLEASKKKPKGGKELPHERVLSSLAKLMEPGLQDSYIHATNGEIDRHYFSRAGVTCCVHVNRANPTMVMAERIDDAEGDSQKLPAEITNLTEANKFVKQVQKLCA